MVALMDSMWTSLAGLFMVAMVWCLKMQVESACMVFPLTWTKADFKPLETIPSFLLRMAAQNNHLIIKSKRLTISSKWLVRFQETQISFKSNAIIWVKTAERVWLVKSFS
jgi:hypothetical protein